MLSSIELGLISRFDMIACGINKLEQGKKKSISKQEHKVFPIHLIISCCKADFDDSETDGNVKLLIHLFNYL